MVSLIFRSILQNEKGKWIRSKPFPGSAGNFPRARILQVFNTFSPNILYGLLGMKLYFYYVPLMFLGYAMLNRPADLDRLLKVSLIVGIVISGLGIASRFGSVLSYPRRYPVGDL